MREVERSIVGTINWLKKRVMGSSSNCLIPWNLMLLYSSVFKCQNHTADWSLCWQWRTRRSAWYVLIPVQHLYIHCAASFKIMMLFSAGTNTCLWWSDHSWTAPSPTVPTWHRQASAVITCGNVQINASVTETKKERTWLIIFAEFTQRPKYFGFFSSKIKTA